MQPFREEDLMYYPTERKFPMDKALLFIAIFCAGAWFLLFETAMHL
jgi:hypothetical protein